MCRAYPYTKWKKRTKLEDKSITCLLLGVSNECKGYRLYDSVTKKIVVSWDVIFKEDKQWNLDASYKKKLLMDAECNDRENEEEYEGSTEEEEAMIIKN